MNDSSNTDSSSGNAGVERRARVRRSDKPAATIYDIARLAGVNPSTVSRALSKPGRISAKTEKRIQDAAKQLDYRANPMAKALPTGRTNTIGLIVADITNPVFFDVMRGAERAASARDYTLVVVESVESAENERRAAGRLLRGVDGLVLAMSRLSDEEIVALADEKPLVLINRQVETVPDVVADVDRGIAEMVRHLASLGHRTVSFVSGPDLSWMSQRRWRSLQERCAWSNIAVTRIPAGSPTVEGGRHAAVAVRDSGATAVIAYNDLMAIGLMQELIMAGISIPSDISVVGFDNIFGSDFTTPPLTTVQSPLNEIGALAVESIIAELDGAIPATSSMSGVLATNLIVRGSTGSLAVV